MPLSLLIRILKPKLIKKPFYVHTGHELYIFASCSAQFTGLSASVVIGQSNNFGFGFGFQH